MYNGKHNILISGHKTDITSYLDLRVTDIYFTGYTFLTNKETNYPLTDDIRYLYNPTRFSNIISDESFINDTDLSSNAIPNITIFLAK
jgi:hypothetical protein